jgi:rhodanese-related sulfurtransferase
LRIVLAPRPLGSTPQRTQDRVVFRRTPRIEVATGRARGRLTLFAIIVALASTAALAEAPGPAQAPSISASELHERRESGRAPIVIDVRTADEYATGHIPGALNIPFDEVARRIIEIDAPEGVALYCMVGPRARKGETALLAVGYDDVFHLEGGLAAWQKAGFPVEDAQ